jgi:hypothetical protein
LRFNSGQGRMEIPPRSRVVTGRGQAKPHIFGSAQQRTSLAARIRRALQAGLVGLRGRLRVLSRAVRGAAS